MRLVGLTGGIGSGKSYVSKFFQELGISVYDADERARLLSDIDPGIRKKIINIFGAEAYRQDKLDRPYIAGIVFDNPDKLEALNGIIHPVVQRDFESWLLKGDSDRYTIKEAAILFETGTYHQLDINILVTAPDEIKIQRIMERDGLNEEQIRMRMKRQWSDEDKINLADFIINNDGKHLLLPQVLEIHNKLVEN